jgi:hypothetical protein
MRALKARRDSKLGLVRKLRDRTGLAREITIKTRRNLYVKGSNSLIIHLRSVSKGAKLQLGTSGLTIKMK